MKLINNNTLLGRIFILLAHVCFFPVVILSVGVSSIICYPLAGLIWIIKGGDFYNYNWMFLITKCESVYFEIFYNNKLPKQNGHN